MSVFLEDDIMQSPAVWVIKRTNVQQTSKQCFNTTITVVTEEYYLPCSGRNFIIFSLGVCNGRYKNVQYRHHAQITGAKIRSHCVHGFQPIAVKTLLETVVYAVARWLGNCWYFCSSISCSPAVIVTGNHNAVGCHVDGNLFGSSSKWLQWGINVKRALWFFCIPQFRLQTILQFYLFLVIRFQIEIRHE
jgi:hypothetical protein